MGNTRILIGHKHFSLVYNFPCLQFRKQCDYCEARVKGCFIMPSIYEKEKNVFPHSVTIQVKFLLKKKSPRHRAS